MSEIAVLAAANNTAAVPELTASRLRDLLVAAWNTGGPFPAAACLSLPADELQAALFRFAGAVSFNVLMLGKLRQAVRDLPAPIQNFVILSLLGGYGLVEDLQAGPGSLVFTVRPTSKASQAALKVVAGEEILFGCLRFYLREENTVELRWTMGHAGAEGGSVRIGNGKRISRMYNLCAMPGLTADHRLEGVAAEDVNPQHPAVIRATIRRKAMGINPDFYPRAGIKHIDIEDQEICDHAIEALVGMRSQALMNRCNRQLADYSNLLRRDVTVLMQHPHTAGAREADVRECLDNRIAAAKLYTFGELIIPDYYLRFTTTPPIIREFVRPDPVLPGATLLNANTLAARDDRLLLCRLASRLICDLEELDATIGWWRFRGQLVKAAPRYDDQPGWDVLLNPDDHTASPELVSVDEFSSATRYYFPQVVDYGRRLFRDDFTVSCNGVQLDLGDWLWRESA